MRNGIVRPLTPRVEDSRVGRNDQAAPGFHTVASGHVGRGVGSSAQRMASDRKVAGRVCGNVWRRQTERCAGCDAGQGGIGEHLRFGFYLSGINDDRLSPAYKTYQPGADFLKIPIWISGGMDDSIATPSSEGAVQVSLQRAGFKRVRVERFMGGHRLKRSEVRLALRWFRELGGF